MFVATRELLALIIAIVKSLIGVLPSMGTPLGFTWGKVAVSLLDIELSVLNSSCGRLLPAFLVGGVNEAVEAEEEEGGRGTAGFISRILSCDDCREY